MIIRYLLVGVFNTFFGFSIIFLCMYLGILAELSNFIGYFFGIILSFFLNKKFTFKSEESVFKEFFKFASSMSVAYVLNLIVLIGLIRFLQTNEYIAQIISGVVYTGTGFLLSKNWVFKK